MSLKPKLEKLVLNHISTQFLSKMTENEEKEVDSSFKDGVFQKKELKIKKCIHFLLCFVNIFSLEWLTGCLFERG